MRPLCKRLGRSMILALEPHFISNIDQLPPVVIVYSATIAIVMREYTLLTRQHICHDKSSSTPCCCGKGSSRLGFREGRYAPFAYSILDGPSSIGSVRSGTPPSMLCHVK